MVTVKHGTGLSEPVDVLEQQIGDTKRELDLQLKEAKDLATRYEIESRKMVRQSTFFDALTVVFGAASPALTTYIAYEDDFGPLEPVFKLGVIFVVAIAVSLPALKRILGIKKRATHAVASAMELHQAVSKAHDEMSRIDDDIREVRQSAYFFEQAEILKSKVSEAQQRHSRLVFDIMEEAHGIAEQESNRARLREKSSGNDKPLAV